MSEPTDRTSQAELRALLRTIEDAGWEYARLEINGVRLEVSRSADFELTNGASQGAPSAITPPQAPSATAPSAEAPAVPPIDVASRPAAKPAEAVAPTPVDTYAGGDVETVISPTIGLVWRSPKPGAPSFVEVGDTVSAGSTVCIVEVMKLMTHVVAPVSGIIQTIHISNGAMVEHGTALLDIVPASAA